MVSPLHIAGALALAYAAVLAFVVLREDRILYHPDRTAYSPPQDSLDLPHSQVALLTDDSVRVQAWEMPPPATVPADSAPWLLYCHGNGGNLGSPGYHEAWAKLRTLGIGILAVDYRGYGESGGVPGEQGLYRDAEAAYRHLRGELGVPPGRIVLYGFSLGSAVAVDLAARLPAAALVVEGAILSVPHRGKELYPFLPVFLLARNRFDSHGKIGRVSAPKLFIHSRDDEVNPFSHSQRLFGLARDPKSLLAVRGSHAEAYRVDPAFFAGLADFLRGLGFPAPAPADKS